MANTVSFEKPKMDMGRALSWSAISSFEYDPEQWYSSYVLGIKAQSREMDFGNKVDKMLQADPKFLPIVERYPIMQHEMRAKFSGIDLVGFADGYDRRGRRLKDDKTGKRDWTQERADLHGQFDMYLLLLWLTEKMRPEDMRCFVSWLPTKDNGDFTITFRDRPVVPVIFETRRTMRQLLEFGARLKRVYKEMQAFAKAHE